NLGRWDIERFASSFTWNRSICCPECIIQDCAAFCEGVDAQGYGAGCGSPFVWATDNWEKEGGFYVPHHQLYIGLTEEMKKDYPWLVNLRALIEKAKREAAKKPSRSKGVQAASKAKDDDLITEEEFLAGTKRKGHVGHGRTAKRNMINNYAQCFKNHLRFEDKLKRYEEDPDGEEFVEGDPFQMVNDGFEIAHWRKGAYTSPWFRYRDPSTPMGPGWLRAECDEWLEIGQIPFDYMGEPSVEEHEEHEVYRSDFNNYENVAETALAIRAEQKVDPDVLNDLELRMAILSGYHYKLKFEESEDFQEWMYMNQETLDKIKEEAETPQDADRRVKANREKLWECIASKVFLSTPENFPNEEVHLYELIPQKGKRPQDAKEVVRKTVMATLHYAEGEANKKVYENVMEQRRLAREKESTKNDEAKAKKEALIEATIAEKAKIHGHEQLRKVYHQTLPTAGTTMKVLITASASTTVSGDTGFVAQLLDIPMQWWIEYFFQFALLVVLIGIAIGIWKMRNGVRKDAVRVIQTPNEEVNPAMPPRPRSQYDIDNQVE
ncbi:MAG: hypothetical protein QF745_06570, partial [Planctomycetota bacterium]|nr:hypothetical protein [Planctomycetota bacterium]